MTVPLILSIFVFSAVLIKAADFLVVAIRRLSHLTGFGGFALSAVIMALATSFPELFVGITSALEGTPNLSLGNVIGSNIANLSLVVGGAAIIFGTVQVHGSFARRDVAIAFGAGLVPLFLLLDGSLSRVDGLILIFLYGLYASSLFREQFVQLGRQQEEEEEGRFWYRFLRYFSHVDGTVGRELGRLFLGIALLLFSADMIVRTAQSLAHDLAIPLLLIGIFLVSLGTVLPELAFSIRSLKERAPKMFFGNILGSIIANGTLVAGVTSLITPIEVQAFDEYLLATTTFVLVYLLFWLFIRSKHRLDRWEAAALFGLYLAFVLVEFSQV